MADNGKVLPVVKHNVKKSVAEAELERQAVNADESNWEWVEIDEFDMLGAENNGVSINFVKYGPGKHFVNPEIAAEIKRIVKVKEAAERRIHQPTQDPKTRKMMANTQLGSPDKM